MTIPSFKPKLVEEPRRFEPQPDIEKLFSTGLQSLDEMYRGGYLRGSTALIETRSRSQHFNTI